MDTYTITVRHNVATIRELGDEEGVGCHPGITNADALGHAIFYLSTIASLEKGVKLDVTQDE